MSFQLSSYLTFNGNCREAMEFYQKCLGGTLELQLLKQTKQGTTLPLYMQEAVVHAQLINGNMRLMATDLSPDEGLQYGNNVCIFLVCNTEATLFELCMKLSGSKPAGRKTKTVANGTLMVPVTDRFGNRWLLYCDKPKQQN